DFLNEGLARRDALLARDVVAQRVAREEPVACGAEALPDRLRPALLDRTDRLPFRLQRADLRGGGIPVGRFGERFRLDAQRFLLREILRPDRLPLREVGVAALKEAIAGGAEAI